MFGQKCMKTCVFFFAFIANGLGQPILPTGTDNSQATSARFLQDIMSMFTTSDTDTSPRNENALNAIFGIDNPPPIRENSMIPPFGINREQNSMLTPFGINQGQNSMIPPFGINRDPKLTAQGLAELPATSMDIVSRVSNMMLQNRGGGSTSKDASDVSDADPRHVLASAGGVFGQKDNRESLPWTSLAKDVLSLFQGAPTTTTTTTTPSPLQAGVRMLNPRNFQQFMPDWIKPFSSFFDGAYRHVAKNAENVGQPAPPPPPPRPQSAPSGGGLLGQFASLLDTKTPSSRLDTGGSMFDRVVVRENANTENPLAALMGGRWNERGLQWTDGNLKVVNKNGNDLLGSELAVHDRSIDIPVQRWMDMANNLAEVAGNSPLLSSGSRSLFNK